MNADNTFTDARDGKKYKTVKIGNQTWMAENLAYKASSGCWAYDNNQENVKTYGYLYDWKTAKKVCPAGWHLPSDNEWEILIDYLGGEDIAGNKLKSTNGWESPNSGATNESGFSALPGGFLGDFLGGTFDNLGGNGSWWTATVDGVMHACFCSLRKNSCAYLFSHFQTGGFSVRCVKDDALNANNIIKKNINNEVPISQISNNLSSKAQTNNISKSSTDKINFDFSDFKFISDDHIRYQNGQVAISSTTDSEGHNKGANRGIKIETNINGGGGYTVTIFNLVGNHPFWCDNIQMAPKQMKIVEHNNSYIKMRGFGLDLMGNSFSDYGITLHLNSDDIDKITLHMYNRNVEIVYLNASNIKSEINSSLSKEKIPIPSLNVNEVIALSDLIDKCQDINTLNHLYSKIGKYNHPQICNDFGVKFFNLNEEGIAKKELIKGAIYGIQYPCLIYSDAMINSVGQCFSILLTQFAIKDKLLAFNMTALGYIYLSRCIELVHKDAFDSFKTRALLFYDKENYNNINKLIFENFGHGTLIEPFLISDLYFASQATNSTHRDALSSAKIIHENLGDISVGGKDADDYSLLEMAEFGEIRHYLLFKTLEKKYKEGQFNMTIEELQRAIV